MKSDLVKSIKRIEMSAYPSCFQMLQGISSVADIIEYADAEDVVILQEDNWYAIIGVSGDTAELVDLASNGGVRNIFRIIRKILDAIPDNVTSITGDFREKTSYRLIRLAERYSWKISTDQSYDWNGEVFHEVVLTR